MPDERVTGGRWLLIGERGGLGEKLGRSLEAAGHTVFRAIQSVAAAPGPRVRVVDDTSASRLRSLLVDAFAGAAPTAIVHLRSLERGDDPNPIDAALARGCDSLLGVVKAVTAMSWRDPPRLWVVTRGAQALGDADVSFLQAPILGLARVIAMEHGELRCGRIDLDGVAHGGEVRALHAELVADDGEDEVAFRGETRSALRLGRAVPDSKPAARIEAGEGPTLCSSASASPGFSTTWNSVSWSGNDPGPAKSRSRSRRRGSTSATCCSRWASSRTKLGMHRTGPRLRETFVRASSAQGGSSRSARESSGWRWATR